MLETFTQSQEMLNRHHVTLNSCIQGEWVVHILHSLCILQLHNRM